MIARNEDARPAIDQQIDALTRAYTMLDGDVGEIVSPAFVQHLTDDAVVNLIVEAEHRKAPLDYVGDVARHEIATRLLRRRKERGDDGAIEIPHPHVEVRLETQYGPYMPDVDALELIAKDLPADDAAKLIKVIPEQRVPAQLIPARTIPAQTLAGATASIMAIARRYAGSTVAKAIEIAMPRERIGDRVVIQPRNAKKRSAR